MKVTIDRFEGKYAVVELENLTMINMERVLLPKTAKEGDLVIITVEDNTDAQDRIRKKMDSLFKK